MCRSAKPERARLTAALEARYRKTQLAQRWAKARFELLGASTLEQLD